MKRWARTLSDAWRRKAQRSAQPLLPVAAGDDDPAALCRRSEAFAEDLGELLIAAPQVLQRKPRLRVRSLR